VNLQVPVELNEKQRLIEQCAVTAEFGQRRRHALREHVCTYCCCCQQVVIASPISRCPSQPDSNQRTGPNKSENHGGDHNNQAALVVGCDEVRRRNGFSCHGGLMGFMCDSDTNIGGRRKQGNACRRTSSTRYFGGTRAHHPRNQYPRALHRAHQVVQ
jgi:hypothetical protein